MIGGQMVPHVLALVRPNNAMRMRGHVALGNGWYGLHPMVAAA